MAIVDTTNLNVFKVGNDISSQQRQAATITVKIGTDKTPLVIDLRKQTQGHNLSNIQGIYVDNSNNRNILLVSTPVGELISIPAGRFATMPLFLSDNPQITLNVALPYNYFPSLGPAEAQVSITLLNFPVPAAVWSGDGSMGPFQELGSSDFVDTPNVAHDSKHYQILGSTFPTPTPLLNGNPNWFINKVQIESAALFSSKPGNVGVVLSDSVTGRTLYVGYVYVMPITAAGGAVATERQTAMFDFGTAYGDGTVAAPSNLQVVTGGASGLVIGPFTGDLDITIIGGGTGQSRNP